MDFDITNVDIDFEALDWVENSHYLASILGHSDTESKVSENSTKANAEIKNNSFRFAEPLSEAELASKIKLAVPKATLYKNAWAVKVFETWREERISRASFNKKIPCLEKKALEDMLDEELGKYLAMFIAEVRKKDGTEYPPQSLHGIISSLQNHMRLQGREVNLFSNEQFRLLRCSLDAAMKHSASEGLGATTQQASIITVEEEDKLWKVGALGEDSPQQLVDTMAYLLGVHFALRGGREHRRLRHNNSQITLGKDDKMGVMYIEYREDVSKTNSGGLRDRKVKAKVTRAYENKVNPSRCIVRLYQKYLSLW